MRIWDVSPGYLSRTRLLGEHSELHALVSFVQHEKQGFARHPETQRWRGGLSALALQHAMLVAEMKLRGYQHRSPLEILPESAGWPGYLEAPEKQLSLLHERYASSNQSGRIPLPRHGQQMWAQHKYSVLARDPDAYQDLGRLAVDATRPESLADIAAPLSEALHRPLTEGGLRNALEHMWGHVGEFATQAGRREAEEDASTLLDAVQRLAYAHRESYLLESTALSEFAVWTAPCGDVRTPLDRRET